MNLWIFVLIHSRLDVSKRYIMRKQEMEIMEKKDMKRNNLFLLSVLVFCIVSFLGTPILGASQHTYEAPEYQPGNYWVYNYTHPTGINYTSRTEVIGKENIVDYWGSSHECYSLERTTDEVVEHLGENFQLNITGSSYETVSNLHIVKEETIANYTNLDTGDNSSQYSLLYYKTNVTTYPFPMQLGFTTNINKTSIVTIILGDNGVYSVHFEEDETFEVVSYTINTELEEKTVPAGTFTCVKVIEFYGDSMHNVTQTSYYSEEIGRDVYWESILYGMGTHVVSRTLLSYEYSAARNRIPGYHFLVFIMACTMISAALIVKKRTRN